jgi:hypothetical protein
MLVNEYKNLLSLKPCTVIISFLTFIFLIYTFLFLSVRPEKA